MIFTIAKWFASTVAQAGGAAVDFFQSKLAEAINNFVLDIATGASNMAISTYSASFDTTGLNISGVVGSLYFDIRTVAGAVSGLALVASLLFASFTGSPTLVMKRVLVDAPKFVLINAFMLAGFGALVQVTDEINTRIVAGVTHNDDGNTGVGALFQQTSDLIEVYGRADPGNTSLSSISLFVLALLLFFSAFVAWIILNVRSAAIYLLVALSPLVAIGVMTSRRQGFTRLLELVFGLVITKTVMIIGISLGAMTLGTAIGGFTADTAALEALTAAPAAPGGADAGAAAAALLTTQGTGLGALAASLTAATFVMIISAASPFLVMQMIPGAEGSGQAGAQGMAAAGRGRTRIANAGRRMRRR